MVQRSKYLPVPKLLGAGKMEAIMVGRTAAAAAEIATLREELAAAKARIQEMGDKDSAFKPFTSWKSRTPTLDDLRERMAALIRDLPRA
jgi:hypothetical protein